MLQKILRGTGWLLALLALLAGAAFLWYRSFDLDRAPRPDPKAVPADLAFLRDGVKERRGRILAVVSSAEHLPNGKKAGYELTELARAYYIFQANGYEVDIASPAGGHPPARIDQDDMGTADYAFLNDPQAQARLRNSHKLAGIDPTGYAAVFFAGGKGTLVDFAGNRDIERILAAIAPRGVVGAVCHGPAALLGMPLAGRRVAAFTTEEELFLIEDAHKSLPFMLEERLRLAGAQVSTGPMYLQHVVRDGRLVTGQNPWSTWAVAEGMIAALGHRPVARAPTPEELSVQVLGAYARAGLDAARKEQAARPGFDKMLILMHAVVAAMQWRPVDAFQLQRLARG